jgi:hypothetical protein
MGAPAGESVVLGRKFLYASAGLGTLLAIALLLLIALEVQWIRCWTRKLASR